MRRPMLVAAFVVFLLFAVSCGGGRAITEDERTENEAAVADLSAQNLAGAFMGDENAANEAYKGKVIFVSGVVENIGVDVEEKSYITLTGQTALVQVMFASEKFQDQALQLQRGQQIKVKARCAGLFANVVLRSAIIVPGN